MSEEWGPWIDHDGKGCPCRGEFVHVICAGDAPWSERARRVGTVISGREWMGIANPQGGDGSWDWRTRHNPIIRYRIRKPRGLVILEQIAQGIRQREGA